MKYINAGNRESVNTVELVEAFEEYPAYVGLDVHKETIVVAVVRAGRGAAEIRGKIANSPKAVKKLVTSLTEEFGGEVLEFSYEAGPCGYVLYRQITKLGQECRVVAPSLIPKKSGERIKTDRRDARKLAVTARSGELTAVWVPGHEQEAMRDLTRARDDFKIQEKKAKQQLNGFVLRHGHSWPANRSRWTQAYYNWLESLKFPHDWQHVVLREYIDSVRAAGRRVADMMAHMERALPQWSLAPVVYSLMALRGVDKITAMGLLAELGDISRFDSPRQLMGYLGLVPSEATSAERRRQGSITKAGNTHARRMLIESAWSYRFPARQTAHMKRKAKQASEEAKQVAWKAQKRLSGRYRSLIESGKISKVATVAVARELTGFIWDIACREMPKVKQTVR
jgi:transposase